MRKTSFFAVMLLMMAFVSCADKDGYEKADRFGRDDFKEVRALKGRTLEFDTPILRPRDLQILDSVLVVIDYNEEKLFHLYDLNTMTKMGARVVSGGGPNDMLRPKFVKGDSDMLCAYDLASSRIVWFDIPDFVSKEAAIVSKSVNTDNPLFGDVVMHGGKLLSCAYESDEFQLRAFDENGKSTGEMLPYPVSHISYTPDEQRDAYYMNFISDGKERIAVFYSMTDLFEVYDNTGRLLTRKHGPDCFFPIFKEVHDGDVVTSVPDDDQTRDAYFSPRSVGDKLFVLYDGDFLNDPNNDGSCSTLFVFSWDGELEMQYQLDDPIYSFNVDAKNRKIFGISKTPEYHIVEYAY